MQRVMWTISFYITYVGERMSNTISQETHYPVMVDMYQQFNTLLDQYHQKHSRIFPVRFDLRYPQDSMNNHSNTDISNCMFKIAQNFRRKGADPVYAWVREVKDSHNPHYHCLLLLNGQKKRNINEVFNVASRLWSSTIQNDAPGLLDRCNKRGLNGVILNCNDESHPTQMEHVKRQISYMAKPNDKAQHKDNLRNYGMSRLH